MEFYYPSALERKKASQSPEERGYIGPVSVHPNNSGKITIRLTDKTDSL